MSLINKVLQDIDRRSVTTASVLVDGDMPGYAYVVGTPQNTAMSAYLRVKYMVMLVLLAIALSAVAKPWDSISNESVVTHGKLNKQAIVPPAPVVAVVPESKPVDKVSNTEPVFNKSNPVTATGNNKLIKASRSKIVRKRALKPADMTVSQLMARLNSKPKEVATRLELAVRYRNNLQWQKAIAVLAQGLGTQSDNARIRYHLAHIYLTLGDKVKAVTVLKAGLNYINSNAAADPAYLSLLASAYQQSEEYLAASTLLERVVSLKPASARDWISLGLAYQSAGNRESAAISYRRALPLLQGRSGKQSLIRFVNNQLAGL